MDRYKVKFTLEHAVKAHRYGTTISLTLELGGVVGQRHSLAAFTPEKRPGTHFTGGWVGPWAGLDGCGKSCPTGIQPPDR
jgi:hypothetical protein